LRQTALVEFGAFNISTQRRDATVHTIALAFVAIGVLTDLEKFGDPRRPARKVRQQRRLPKTRKTAANSLQLFPIGRSPDCAR
jgi:hypothetical protein